MLKPLTKIPLDVFLRHIAKNCHYQKALQSVKDKMAEIQIQNNYDWYHIWICVHMDLWMCVCVCVPLWPFTLLLLQKLHISMSVSNKKKPQQTQTLQDFT